MIYGYARVSTSDQETRLQIDALTRAGAEVIYSEKTSSVGKRPELQNLLAILQKGDLLMVWKLDRIARSLKDLLNILERLSSAGIGLRSLTEPIDTSSHLGVFMLQILGAVAQLERSMIRERAIAGQVAARMRGVTWGGRPLVLTETDLDEFIQLHEQDKYTWVLLAQQWGCKTKDIFRALARRKKRALGPLLPPVLGPYLLAASMPPKDLE